MTETQTPDDEQICRDLAVLRNHAYLMGFERAGTRGDHELELTTGGVRIRFNTHYTHGEGRLLLNISGRGRPERQVEIRVLGTNVEAAKRELANRVRRAVALS